MIINLVEALRYIKTVTRMPLVLKLVVFHQTFIIPSYKPLIEAQAKGIRLYNTIILTDKNYQRRYVDSYLWSFIPKTMFDLMWNPNWDISHTRYKHGRCISPREYVAKDFVKLVLVTPCENATIPCFGEWVKSSSNVYFLKYSPFSYFHCNFIWPSDHFILTSWLRNIFILKQSWLDWLRLTHFIFWTVFRVFCLNPESICTSLFLNVIYL